MIYKRECTQNKQQRKSKTFKAINVYMCLIILSLKKTKRSELKCDNGSRRVKGATLYSDDSIKQSCRVNALFFLELRQTTKRKSVYCERISRTWRVVGNEIWQLADPQDLRAIQTREFRDQVPQDWPSGNDRGPRNNASQSRRIASYRSFEREMKLHNVQSKRSVILNWPFARREFSLDVYSRIFSSLPLNVSSTSSVTSTIRSFSFSIQTRCNIA